MKKEKLIEYGLSPNKPHPNILIGISQIYYM